MTILAYAAAVGVGLYVSALYAVDMASRGRACDMRRLTRAVIDVEVDRWLARPTALDDLVDRLVRRTPGGVP